MKAYSDDFRESSICGVIRLMKEAGAKSSSSSLRSRRMSSRELGSCTIEIFKSMSAIIVANCVESALEDVQEKIYTRDLYFRD